MTITAAFVLFAVIWFIALLVALPIGLTTQGEAGEVVPGTPASAPVDAMLQQEAPLGHPRRRWRSGARSAPSSSGAASRVRDLDVFGRM